MDDAQDPFSSRGDALKPAEKRVHRAKELESDISARCRFVATGTIAVVWGLFLGDSKSLVPLRGTTKAVVLAAAASAVLVLLFDYIQTLLEYLDAKFIWGRFLGLGGQTMFVGKQVLALIAATALLAAAFFLILQPSKAAGGSIQWCTVWKGSMTTEGQPYSNRSTIMYMSCFHPYTRWVDADVDGASCKGKLKGRLLDLRCGSHLYLGGVFESDKRRVYHGKWKLIDSGEPEGGSFEYRFTKNYNQ